MGLAVDGDFFCLITNVRHYESGVLGNILEGKVTVDVGGNGILGAFHRNGSSNHGFFGAVDHRTGYGDILRIGIEAYAEHQQEKHGFPMCRKGKLPQSETTTLD